jgi:hypothetical protein
MQKCPFSLTKRLFMLHIAVFYGTFDGRYLIYDEMAEIPLTAVQRFR